ncbi:hypothetical protein IGA_04793 [Bacillus cereus HuA3-9]|uniref:Uncharacterized protein n=1 Tax=Bacillus cereus HuA3-9 TaxID=1053205 RepID=R8CMF2_BACCE|nr:hypothetical protein IGA_04793 [Bacillus cereus HuA3-9]
MFYFLQIQILYLLVGEGQIEYFMRLFGAKKICIMVKGMRELIPFCVEGRTIFHVLYLVLGLGARIFPETLCYYNVVPPISLAC